MGAESESPDGRGLVEVALTLAGLPPGAQVHSCHVGRPIPARLAIWGSHKLRYH